MATEKILLQFEADIKDLKSELSEVKSQLGNVEKQTEQAGSKITNTFKNVGKAIAGAFAVREIVRFGQEAVRLAATLEGVEAAFNRISTPGLLKDLREATKGTVSDLELMTAAVKANNFRVPLEQLAKYFQFATQRAKETGESVDYLVQSIVEGVGKNQTLILDNLGLSVIEIREEMKKTGDMASAVGKIIDKSMGSSNDTVETSAEKIARVAASWKNFQANVGQELLPTIEVLADALMDVGRFAVGAQDAVFNLFASLGSARAQAALNDKDTQAMIDTIIEQNKTYDELSIRLEQLKKEYEDVASSGKVVEHTFFGLKIGTNEAGKAKQDLENRIAAVTFVMNMLNKTITGTEDGSGDGGTNGALNDQIEAQRKLAEKATELAKALAAIKDEEEQLPKAIRDQLEWERKRAEAYDTLQEKFEAYIDPLERYADIQNEINFLGLSQDTVISNLTARYNEGLLTQEQYNDLIRDRIELLGQETQASLDEADALALLGQGFGNLATGLGALGKENERFMQFQLFATTAQILFSQAASLANALKTASTSSPDAITFFVQLSSMVAAITAFTGQALGIANSANVPQYAEGVVDLKGAGTETSDSIHARLSRGESVITAKGTRQDKGLFEAANKMQLERYINENYVLPALVKVKSEERQMFDDYRLYLALKDGQKQDRDLNKKLIQVLSRRDNRYNSWA